jgi:hypothetical protein
MTDRRKIIFDGKLSDVYAKLIIIAFDDYLERTLVIVIKRSNRSKIKTRSFIFEFLL